jgi:hypothetical protein
MKLEEVLQHLRTGGLVKVTGSIGNPKLNLDQLIRSYTTEILINLDFEIVKKPHKAEYIVEKSSYLDYSIDGDIYSTFSELLPESGRLYRVTIEEIR